MSNSSHHTSVRQIQDNYMSMAQRKRSYGLILLLVFVALMVSGFQTAQNRNAGGFWDGIHRIFDFPAGVISEAIEKNYRIANSHGNIFPRAD